MGVCVQVLCAEYHTKGTVGSGLRLRSNVASMVNGHSVADDYKEGAFHPRMNV